MSCSKSLFQLLHRHQDNVIHNTWQITQAGISLFNFTPGAAFGEQLLFSMYGDGTDYYYRTDGTQGATKASTDAIYLESIGADQSWNRFNGNVQELVVYTADQSSNVSGIETNMNDYFSIYT